MLDVLAERELHSGHCVGELQFLGRYAPTELDHLVLSAHRIGGAVQHVRGRHPAGQLSVKSDVGRINHVADPHFARHGVTRFIHAAADRRVRMAIDNARRDVHSFAVDNRRAARRLQSRPHRRNLSAGN